MKRCPDCEFIYDDYQSLCDMDGHQLVYDSRLTALARTTSAPVQSSRKDLLKRIAIVSVLVGLSFATLAGIAYYGAPSQFAKSESVAAPSSYVESKQEVAITDQPAVPATSAGEVNEVTESVTSLADDNHVTKSPKEQETGAVDRRLSIARGLPPLPRVPPLPRLPAARVDQNKIKTGNAPAAAGRNPRNARVEQKKESKLGSFLKKTGRMIKKPFKL